VKRDRPEGLQKGKKGKKSPGTHAANKDDSALTGKGSRADDEDIASVLVRSP